MSAGFFMHGGAAGVEASAPQPVKMLPFVEDDDTTDAGSDLETVCTSAQASDSEDGHPRAHGRLLLSTGGSRRARAPRFRSALATIPGTPVNRPLVSRPPGNWTAAEPWREAAPAASPPGLPRRRLPAPRGLLSTGGSAATAAPVLATQAPKQKSLAPQRVSLPCGAEARPTPLDPAVPAKKKPLFGPAEDSAGVDRSMPLKKRVTNFLVQDARCVLETPLLH